MHTVYLNVPYKPTPQQRHRHTRGGRTYDPCCQLKRDFLALCRAVGSPPEPRWHACPVKCDLQFTFARPKSHFTSRRALRKGVPERHIYKPDVDNLAKFVMDALNATYYKADSQVFALHVAKRYGDENSVRVRLEYHDPYMES